MKAKISALMDGELDGREAAGALEALRAEGEVRESWRTYHLISDAMRDTHPLSAGFSARVATRLAGEPTVLAPKWGFNSRPLLEQRRWQVLSAAASVAAIGFVSLSFFSQEPSVPAQPLAAGAAAPQAESAQVAPPAAANDYLLAHQAYSPRISLQGVAPYVRTVSSERRGSRQ
ncbi:MAG: sigma-E factor negative regulatory protein [Burkholderiales bacterium]